MALSTMKANQLVFKQALHFKSASYSRSIAITSYRPQSNYSAVHDYSPAKEKSRPVVSFYNQSAIDVAAKKVHELFGYFNTSYNIRPLYQIISKHY